MKDVSVIIVHYNTKEFIRKCLLSLKEHVSKDISYEVIVVDNASTDGVEDEISNIKNKIANMTFIKNSENMGFSRANNIGIKRSSARYILFLNPDTEVEKGTLENMVRFMDEHEDTGAATCFLRLANGKLDDAAHRGFPTPWNALCYFSGLAQMFPKSTIFNGYHLGYQDLDKVHEVDAVAGAFMIVRRKAGEEIGWWDEDYFFYGEDLDFCYKLKQKGWKIYFVPDVSVFHHKGVSGGIKKHSQNISTADDETRRRVQTARFDAMRIFYQKHYQHNYPRVLKFLVLFGISLKQRMTV